MKDKIVKSISQSIETKNAILRDEALVELIEKCVGDCVNALGSGNKLLFCGNGGSAADAQHIAAELSGRFKLDREPLYAEALHVNSSFMTAVANDYGYEEVFARLVRGMGKPGDILFVLSTSGNSPNILKAAKAAKGEQMTVIGMTGASGGELKLLCDRVLRVPSDDTARIQEAHILIGHIICELVEARTTQD